MYTHRFHWTIIPPIPVLVLQIWSENSSEQSIRTLYSMPLSFFAIIPGADDFLRF